MPCFIPLGDPSDGAPCQGICSKEPRSPGVFAHPIGILTGPGDPLGVQLVHVSSRREMQNFPSVLGKAVLCTWATGLADAGSLLGVVRGVLLGLLAEGQEEVCAQWLRKVHLQVCPHEQLEDIIANWLRGTMREKSVERSQVTEGGKEGKGVRELAREMGRQA